MSGATVSSSPYIIGEGKHEAAMRERLREILKDHWKIEEEVWGTGPGGITLRADAIIRPLDPSGWKDPNVAFVVECKAAERHKQMRDRSHWLRQCVDYTYTRWRGYGFRCVLTFPSAFGEIDKDDRREERHLLGALGVGELFDDRWNGWSIFLSGHRLWGAKHGVCDGANWTCRKRFGA
jgi:hypothetical protein